MNLNKKDEDKLYDQLAKSPEFNEKVIGVVANNKPLPHAAFMQVVEKRVVQTHDINGFPYSMGNRSTRRLANKQDNWEPRKRQLHKQGHKLY